ncbi:MAG TPA: hypothetical protein VIC33_07265 [Vicinamibacterales bacterium]|jgi:hypothetical protein
MRKLLPALCVAAALGFGCSATTYRRDARYRENRPVAVTGCLLKAHSGGYILANASVQNGFRQDERGPAVRRDENRWTDRMWKLEHGQDLDQHVNQLVQVIGMPEDDTSDVRPTRESDKVRVRDFNVQGMRLLGPCR